MSYKVIPLPKAKKIYSRDYVYNLYVTQQLMQGEVASILNISGNAVKSLLEYFDIKVRSKSESRKISLSKLTPEERSELGKRSARGREKRTDEQKAETRAKTRATWLKKYGVEYACQSEVVKNKSRQTCLERYGVDHPMKVEEIKNKCVTASTTTIRNKTTEEKAEIVAKANATKKNKTDAEKAETHRRMSEARKRTAANMTAEAKKEMYRKAAETKRKNHTFNTSRPEKELYEQLVIKYGVEDVKTQYVDDRYPFHCDFYIVSKDLFIELNKFPVHYTEPFDETNEEHVALLEHCKTNPQNWIEEGLVRVWAGSDVVKMNTAKQNNLNYVVIY